LIHDDDDMAMSDYVGLFQDEAAAEKNGKAMSIDR
jgi:hypothetical protein